MRLHAPELETQGWEVFLDKETGEGLGVGKQVVGKKLGKAGKMLEEWTTGHPKVCPVTGDLVFYGYNMLVVLSSWQTSSDCVIQLIDVTALNSVQSSLAAPFVTHSVIRKDGSHSPSFKTPVPGINRPKMMHDFAVSLHHSIILDLPLTMDPLNIVIGKPMLSFNRNLKSRFGVVPRYYDGHDTSQVKWFEDDKPSLIFHTADAWDEGTSGNQYSGEPHDEIVAVNMYGCRFRTSKLVYAAGSMCGPVTEEALARELSDVVRLTYFRFSMSPNDSLFRDDAITHAFSLSAIPFEFPVVCQQQSMRQHRFIYGCTLRSGAFDAALEGAKIDCIIKMDVEALRKKGMDMVARNELDKFEDVDKRSVEDILEKQRSGKIDNDIAVFDLPEGHVGQEPAFILKTNAVHEDDGYLVFYIYDEAQLLNNGDAPDDSKSQLYVVDASLVGVYPSSLAVVAIVDLPSRVPYGLHSNFITAEQIESQIQANNTNASIIEDVIVKEGGSSDTLDLKPRLRRATVAAADRSEQLQRDLVHKAHSVNDATILLWIAALFWTLVHHIDCAVYSDRARSLRSIRHQKPTSCVQQMERPDLIRRRTISISSHSHVPDFSSEQS